ncbi:hypothetical protein RHSIM_Rhsim09G0016000 [Rhododendron simsii]|uniref:Uncharacterized protein n=1 Tax=Rhododendron simsii TaxID=118357 RepID=A0A834GCG7_RHOSS|nr:hypothetical protein RHSIM_Rhsim09G0016000 [Rhododendron simsii]
MLMRRRRVHTLGLIDPILPKSNLPPVNGSKQVATERWCSTGDGGRFQVQRHLQRCGLSGEDCIQFLHNRSTANFECLQEGQGCDTVFVTPTARTIDIGHAWIMRNAVTLVVSPMTSESITQMLRNLSPFPWMMFSLATELYTVFLSWMPVTLAAGNVISEEGFSLLMSPAAAGTVWKTLLSQGAIPMGSKAWETFRVFQGR